MTDKQTNKHIAFYYIDYPEAITTAGKPPNDATSASAQDQKEIKPCQTRLRPVLRVRM